MSRDKDINFCLFPSYHLGNGIVVCELDDNKLPKDTHIAHIDKNRKVKFFKEVDNYVKEYINNLAISNDRYISYTQNVYVFLDRPKKEDGLNSINYTNNLLKKGKAGILSNGNIVDTRIYPNSIPVKNRF